MGFQRAKFVDPEIFSLQQGVPNLLLCHVPVRDFFYYDHSEIFKGVPWFSEMLVYRYCAFFFAVISVLVYSPVCFLGLDFAYVLFLGIYCRKLSKWRS